MGLDIDLLVNLFIPYSFMNCFINFAFFQVFILRLRPLRCEGIW